MFTGKLSRLFILILFVLPRLVSGQNFYRLKADVSIKNKSETSANLVTGKVYFDKNNSMIIYDCSFPRKEVTVIKDSITYYIVDNKLVNTFRSSLTVESSVFQLALTGNLNNFGLENTMYKASKIEKDSNMVITSWVPDEKFEKMLGVVKTSVVDNRLYGVVFYNADKVLIGKQFFSNYVNVKGIDFPGEVLHITYNKDNKEAYQITTYKNIVLNEEGQDTLYNYRIPQ
jgi:hypothetical protein